MLARSLLLLTGALACASAGAQDFNARKHSHCGVALQASSEVIAKAHGLDSTMAEELHLRIRWEQIGATHAGDVDSVEPLRRRFAGDSDAALTAAEQCILRQEAHPSFRAAVAERDLFVEAREEPANLLAAMTMIKRTSRNLRFAGGRD